MDLLQTVRKEGPRGGVNFSWDDVKSSSHRENYLGHSLMAPVGRWQKNKDLGWYAKADDAELTPEERAEKERERKREEMRKVKEAEEDAMARALGLPVPDRTNANNEPLGESKISQKEVNKALKEALDDGDEEAERGVGFGGIAAEVGSGGGIMTNTRSLANDAGGRGRDQKTGTGTEGTGIAGTDRDHLREIESIDRGAEMATEAMATGDTVTSVQGAVIRLEGVIEPGRGLRMKIQGDDEKPDEDRTADLIRSYD